MYDQVDIFREVYKFTFAGRILIFVGWYTFNLAAINPGYVVMEYSSFSGFACRRSIFLQSSQLPFLRLVKYHV